MVKRKSRDDKSAKSYDGSSSKGKPDIQDKPRFKKRVYNQFLPKFHKNHYDMTSNPKTQKERGTSSPNKKTTFGKFGKKNYVYCVKRTDNWFDFCKSGHIV